LAVRKAKAPSILKRLDGGGLVVLTLRLDMAHIAKICALVVDDEPLARSNLTVLLRQDAAVGTVRECGSGTEAIAEIRNSKPDLVFLDVQMPECDGFDVLEMLGVDLPPGLVFVTA